MTDLWCQCCAEIPKNQSIDLYSEPLRLMSVVHERVPLEKETLFFDVFQRVEWAFTVCKGNWMSLQMCDCCVDWIFVVHCEIILWHIKPEIIPFTGQSLVSISASSWGRCTVSVQMHHHVCHNPASARPALQMLRWKSRIWMSVDNIVTWSVKLN